jgi:AICAR transformylase/IMP cyclohydrolase PurH
VDSPFKGERIRQVRGGFVRENVRLFIPYLAGADSENHIRIRGKENRIMYHCADLILAWAVGSSSTSNSITIVHDTKMLANACGIQSRIGACLHAHNLVRQKGSLELKDFAAYSDGFFPFADGLTQLRQCGVDIVLYPRGSIKDDEIGQALQGQMTLVTLPEYARGFYGH